MKWFNYKEKWKARFAWKIEISTVKTQSNQCSHTSYGHCRNFGKELNGLTWIRKGKPLPKNTVTSRFNTAPQNILNCSQAEGETVLLDWFDCNLRYEVYEEVMGLGQYGKTLTVLSLGDIPGQEELDDEDDLVESWTPRFKR